MNKIEVNLKNPPLVYKVGDLFVETDNNDAVYMLVKTNAQQVSDKGIEWHWALISLSTGELIYDMSGVYFLLPSRLEKHFTFLGRNLYITVTEQ